MKTSAYALYRTGAVFQHLDSGQKPTRRLKLTDSSSFHPLAGDRRASDLGLPNQRLIPGISDLNGMKLKFRELDIIYDDDFVSKCQEWWFEELRKNRVTNMMKVKKHAK